MIDWLVKKTLIKYKDKSFAWRQHKKGICFYLNINRLFFHFCSLFASLRLRRFFRNCKSTCYLLERPIRLYDSRLNVSKEANTHGFKIIHTNFLNSNWRYHRFISVKIHHFFSLERRFDMKVVVIFILLFLLINTLWLTLLFLNLYICSELVNIAFLQILANKS